VDQATIANRTVRRTAGDGTRILVTPFSAPSSSRSSSSRHAILRASVELANQGSNHRHEDLQIDAKWRARSRYAAIN